MREDGTVKVLDFGLAKALDPNPEGDSSQSPTLTAAATQMGMVIGTAAYMSPEQARGKPVDKRADIWAFGAVFYEMLTGRRAFEGEDVASTLAFVLAKEADWRALPSTVPDTLRRLVRRCLAHDPRQRLRDIGDACAELRELLTGPVEDGHTAPVAPQPVAWRRTAVVGLVMLVLGAAVAGVGVWQVTRRDDGRVQRFDVTPRGINVYVGNNTAPHVSVSPDGRLVAFVGRGSPRQLHLRSVDRLEVRTLSGLGNPVQPFFSPDGEWIGFLDGTMLKKVNVNGGPAVTLGNIGGTALLGASWAADGTITFAANLSRGLFRVSADGGDPEALTSLDEQNGEVAHAYPEVLPGGHAVLFTIFSGGGSVANAQIAVLDLRTGQREVVVRGGSQPRYARTGHIVYGADGELWAVAFDADRLVARGDPVRVQEDVNTTTTGGVNYAVAHEDGSLVYIPGSSVAARRQLVWVDRQGLEEPIGAEPRVYVHARISPDGTRVALDVRDQENDIWIWDFASETPTRLTFNPGLDRQPVWTRDGQKIAFSSDRDEASNLYWVSADGTGVVERLTESPYPAQPNSFSPDGAQLVIWESRPDSGLDVAIVHLEGERRITPVFDTGFDERNAELSPDGRWIAYQSNDSGRYEVYVQPFPEVDGGRWQISSGGGTRPMWAPDGRELFYFAEPGRLMVVPVEAGATFARGNPQVLFEGPYAQPLLSRTFDITPDGQRFLMIKEGQTGDDTAPSGQIILVQNWFSELERLVPVN